MSETAITAIVSALLGFLGGLIPSITAALRAKETAKQAAKKSDLDALRTIITDLQEELKRRNAERKKERDDYEERLVALETNCDEKDQLIGKMEEKLKGMRRERSQFEARIKNLAEYIEVLIEVMKEHNIPVPERKGTGPLGEL